MREPAHDNIALAPHITEPQHSNRIAYRIRYPRLEVSIGYITTDIRCTTPSPLCQCPCGQKTAHKLWSINALPAEETSSQTHESTAAVCPASSCRESPGSCLFLCVGIGWVWLSLINHPWFTAESEAGASIGLQNEAVITTPPEKKHSHIYIFEWHGNCSSLCTGSVATKTNVSGETDLIVTENQQIVFKSISQHKNKSKRFQFLETNISDQLFSCLPKKPN